MSRVFAHPSGASVLSDPQPCKAASGGVVVVAVLLAEARKGLGQDAGEGGLGTELGEHADATEPDPVDEQVLRRKVDLQHGRVAGSPRVVDPGELPAHPLATEVEGLGRGGLDERREVRPQVVDLDLDPWLDEAEAAEAG